MSGDVHVRFYEGLGVKFPGATHQKSPAVSFAEIALKVRQAKPGGEVGHVKEEMAENF